MPSYFKNVFCVVNSLVILGGEESMRNYGGIGDDSSTVALPMRPVIDSLIEKLKERQTNLQFFFLLEIFFLTVSVCYFKAPFLMRGRVCNLLLLLVLPSTVMLGSALSDERSGLSFVSISL
jgi:hypothetical protein